MLKRNLKKSEGDEDNVIVVDGLKLDAEKAEVVFADPDKDIQVVISEDPENRDNAVVAVMTASADDPEEEKVLGSATLEPEGDGGEGDGAGNGAGDESKKAEARKKRIEAFRKRMAERKAKQVSEARKKAIKEARAKFRAHVKK